MIFFSVGNPGSDKGVLYIALFKYNVLSFNIKIGQCLLFAIREISGAPDPLVSQLQSFPIASDRLNMAGKTEGGPAK